VDVPYEYFAARCERILESSAAEEVSPFAGDIYLCCGCACGIPEASHALEREGGAVARAAIAKIDSEPEFIRDVLQDLWNKLLVGPNAKIREYAGRGPVFAWLRVAAARLALDRVRARRNARVDREDLEGAFAAAAKDCPEFELIRARYGASFQQALRRALANLSLQERNVLRMHVVGHCSIDHIGRAYGVHRATAARWLERTRCKIYETARDELGALHPELTESEFRSLARAAGGDVELSLFDTTHTGQSDASDDLAER
jgi:RNA polymerase sigma-70 factor (ECF subfamily)